MWIVRLALKRPYTFIVAALLIFIGGALAILNTPTDIFPEIDIPVVSVIWTYNGYSADDMANRITGRFERVLTTTVNDIEHTESQSLRGRTIIKIFFHRGAKVEAALAELASISQTIVKDMPPGTTAPLLITYKASSVPVLQLGLSSNTLSEQELNDLGTTIVRGQLVTVPGVGIPGPYGGKQPLINVDIDLKALQSKGLSPEDVVQAVSAQNLVLAGGTAKIGSIEYEVEPNGSPPKVEELNNLPVKQINGSMVYIRDVANVHTGFDLQTNIVRKDGVRGVMLSILKTGSTSTLDIVAGVKAMLPKIAAQLPEDLKITPLFDQSLFVRAAVKGVLNEGVLAAILTGLMILLFLGSWRSTLIIVISIPLSILCSICALSALGETINLMTLGGLALAIGMLVDDATVGIENINRHLEKGVPLEEAILEGSREIAIPAFVSTLCICIVFIPMFFLTGVARFLFIPMAEAVVFAMLASYVISRTLVPTLAMYLLGPDHEHVRSPAGSPASGTGPGFLGRVQARFEGRFEQLRQRYNRSLETILHHRALFTVLFLGFCVASLGLAPFLGEDFFPEVDAGQFRLHIRARTGTRIEEVARLCDLIEAKIREVIPPGEIADMLDNIGPAYSAINTSYSSSGTVGTFDAEILGALKPGHGATAGYVSRLRQILPSEFPGVAFYFQPADMVAQILNFGLPSPIDIQIVGRDLAAGFTVAGGIVEQIKQVPGIADPHIQQMFDQPQLLVDFDRTKAEQMGLTQRDLVNDMLVTLSGSGQTSPAFWVNPQNKVIYGVASRVQDYQIDSLQALQAIPVSLPNGPEGAHEILGNFATFSLGFGPGVESHYNVTPTIDIYASTQGRDLGGIARDIEKIVQANAKKLPRGSSIVMKGQVETMRTSFRGLGFGILGAVVLVYLLIVVNFQSWTDPFIIITGLPGALAGIVWMLFVTGTTINVPSLMGAIMCVGVATANSILIISFAKEHFEKNGNAFEAALEAGTTRLRPVLMTALAMIIGMIPMAFGFGEGGEQNAPLARAVIGGLLFATVATLFFVPVVFTLVRHGPPGKAARQRRASPDIEPSLGRASPAIEL